MENEQTNTTDTEGSENTISNETNNPVSLYEKTEAIVKRQEEANKKTEELLKRQETLYANQRLAGTTGIVTEKKQKEESEREYSERIHREIAEGKYND